MIVGKLGETQKLAKAGVGFNFANRCRHPVSCVIPPIMEYLESGFKLRLNRYRHIADNRVSHASSPAARVVLSERLRLVTAFGYRNREQNRFSGGTRHNTCCKIIGCSISSNSFRCSLRIATSKATRESSQYFRPSAWITDGARASVLQPRVAKLSDAKGCALAYPVVTHTH